jgi:predicted dehydrogenase
VIEISRAEPGSVASRDTNRCTHASIGREIYLGKQRKERHELIYFSDCIIHDRAHEPSGKEALADIRMINAIYESAEIGRAVRIEPVSKKRRPNETMQIKSVRSGAGWRRCSSLAVKPP